METVDQTRQRIEAIIKEKAPDIDLTPGSVLSELLTKHSAEAQNEVYNSIAAIEAAKVVKDVLDSAEDSYSETIERLASNYETYRNEGKKANGQLKVYVSQAKNYFLPSGLKFVQPSLAFSYVTVTSYTVSSTSSPVVLKQEGAQFYFMVPVESSEVGNDKQVSHGTQFALDNPAVLPEFVSATAFGAFSQGQDKETDKDLITRFRLGLSTKNLVTPYAIESVLKDRYPNFKSVAVRSSGDPEEIRGKENPLGITIPGMVDVYVRMSYALATVTATFTGNKLLSGDNAGKWQIDVNATSVPGFYKVLSIVKSASNEAGTAEFVNVAYGYDTALYERKNSVTSTEQARFSKYQTCSIIFDHTEAVATSVPFDVTFLHQPQIAEIQDLFLNDAERIPCADYLVKGVVPCNVSINLKLVKNNSFDTLDTTAIKSAIFSYINGLSIGEPVSASKIIDICHNYNIKRVDLPIIMNGTIFVPYSNTDELVYISSTDTLEIPNMPARGVTANTSAFFINYFDENGSETIGVEAA